MKIQIPRASLAVALLFAGKADIRYYLNGVRVEVLKGETRVIGCDGLSLGVVRHASTEGNDPIAFTIPRSTAEIAAKSKSALLEIVIFGTAFTIGGGEMKLGFTPAEGDHYPDYRRVIPSSVSGEASAFSIALLNPLLKAAKLFGAKDHDVIVRQSGASSMLCQIFGHPEFIAVVMPMRQFTEKRPDPGVPAWVNT